MGEICGACGGTKKFVKLCWRREAITGIDGQIIRLENQE
jgi:hypothetical protein